MKKFTDEKREVKGKEGKGVRRLRMGSILAFLFLLLYVPSFINWLHGDNISSDILRTGSIEESNNADGVVVRDEILLNAPSFSGTFIPEVNEGERVPVNCRIATILNGASDNLLKELQDINQQIVQVQRDKAAKADFFSEDATKIDNSIGSRVQDIMNLCNTGSIDGLGSIKTEIDKLIEKKAEILGSDSSDPHMTSLKNERDEIQKHIDANTGKITSGFSGIISYILDGYEQILTPDAINSLTPEFIEGIRENKINNALKDTTVQAGKPFAKVIRGSYLYIAAVLDTDKAAEYKSGQSVSIRVNNVGIEVPGTITGIIDGKKGKSIVVAETDRGFNDLIDVRKVNVDLIISSKEGLKVPLSCLLDVNRAAGTAKIMLIKANCASGRIVDIVSSDKDYAIIQTPEGEHKNTVNLYDTYILNPDNVTEGEIVCK